MSINKSPRKYRITHEKIPFTTLNNASINIILSWDNPLRSLALAIYCYVCFIGEEIELKKIAENLNTDWLDTKVCFMFFSKVGINNIFNQG